MLLHIDDTKKYLVIDRCTQVEYDQLILSYQKYAKNYKFHPKYKSGLWDGKINFIKGQYIPATTYKYLFDLCSEYNFDCEINGLESIIDEDINFEDFKTWGDDFFKDTKWKPRYYQIDSAYSIIKYRRCMGNSCTSSGKTLLSFMIFAYLLTHKKVNKILVVVPTVGLVLQTSGDYEEYNSDKLPINIQQVYSGCKYRDNTNIVVGTYQTLTKEPKEFFDQFDCVFVDEVHKGSCTSIQKILDNCNYEYKFGLSGTIPNMKTAEGLTLCSSLGPIVFNITASQLQDEGYISNCKITQVRLNYTNDEQKESFKNAKKQLTKVGKGADMYRIETKFINESQKRFNVITKLISKTDKNTMVLFKEIDYGKQLFKWLKENTNKMVYYIDGQISTEVREEIRKRMELKNDVILVASFGTSSTGISINNIFNIFFVSSYKSTSTILQSIGRGLRKSDAIGKDFVNIYDISDDLYTGCYEMSHARERIKIYESQCFPYEVKKLKI